MPDRLKLTSNGKAWHIMARKGAGTATEAAWLSVGGCTSQTIATRVYLALMTREGR